ncbi:MAG: ABC transporter permease [Solirubrobacterales bacterium]
MATLRAIGALGVRSVKQTLRGPRFLAPLLLFPSLFLAINVGGAGSATRLPGFPAVDGFLDFELAAAILQATLLGGLTGGIALAMDIENGFSDRLTLAPINRFAMVLGRLAGTVSLGIISGVWFVGVGLIFGASIKAGVAGAVLLVALSALTTASFGALAAALALRLGRVATVQGMFPLVFVILFLSSAFFPEQLLVEPARSIAAINPLSFIAEGMRDLVIRDLSVGDLAQAAVAIAGIMAVGIGLSAWALRYRLRVG